MQASGSCSTCGGGPKTQAKHLCSSASQEVNLSSVNSHAIFSCIAANMSGLAFMYGVCLHGCGAANMSYGGIVHVTRHDRSA